MSETPPELVASELALNAVKQRQLELEVAAMERMASRVLSDPEHTGRFEFVGPIMEGSAHTMIRQLSTYAARYPGAPIEILLNSPGGSVLDGFALVDYLQRLQRQGHEITIVGIGEVASMAAILLQVADVRILTNRAWLCVHEVSQVVHGSITVAEDTLKLSKALQGRAVELLCARSTMTPRKLEAMWKRRDVFMDAPECLKHGFIDRIEGSDL
jgi:ATP-dependent Clp protease protease subunit